MIKPQKGSVFDEKIYKAIINLDKNESFIMLVEWIGQSMVKNAMSSTLQKDDVMSRWLQGRTQELEELLGYIRNARTSYENMQETKPSGMI